MISPGAAQNRLFLPKTKKQSYELNPQVGYFSIVSPSGAITTLNSLGVKVMDYSGGGMAPIEIITTPLGILGGSVEQRTVARPQIITLACIVFGSSLLRIQRIKQSLISLLAPSVGNQASQAIKLRYQLFDDCGKAAGNILEAPCLFMGDLTGTTDNINEDKFVLQFMVLTPPAITELTLNTTAISFNSVVGTAGLRYRQSTGAWATQETTPGVYSPYYDSAGDLFYGTTATAGNAFVKNRSGTINQAVTFTTTPANSTVQAVIKDAAGNIYATGNFNSPQAFIMKYTATAGTWGAMGTGLSASGSAFCFDRAGNLYVTGLFASAGGVANTLNIAMWNGTAWVALGTGLNGQGWDIALGPDGNIYVVGAFTLAGGVANTVKVARWNTTTLVWEPLSTGASATLQSLCFLPDGRLMVAGLIGTIGGVTVGRCFGIWNGTSWADPNTSQLPSTITLGWAVRTASNGQVYALVNNTGTPTTQLYIYTGSVWVPTELRGSVAFRALAIRQSDNEIAVSNSTSFDYNTAFYTLFANAGTAEVYPQIKITGPGYLSTISNYSAGRHIYFNNYFLQAGEIITMQAGGPNGASFISSVNGNILGRLASISDLINFYLLPGNNNITAAYSSTTAASKIEIIYKNTHWSFEAGV